MKKRLIILTVLLIIVINASAQLMAQLSRVISTYSNSATTIVATEDWSEIMDNTSTNYFNHIFEKNAEGVITTTTKSWQIVYYDALIGNLTIIDPDPRTGLVTFDGTHLSFTVQGTARLTSPSAVAGDSSTYTLSITGVGSNGSASGTYTIDFANSRWPSKIQGTWIGSKNSGSGVLSEIYVAPKTVSIIAGGLYSALTTTEKATLTELTVTGNMDARDFRIMRDSMPLLANLDLSNSTLVAYVGSEGTVNNNYFYPDNTIPRNALIRKTSLQRIVLPNTLTAVGRSGFNGCTALSSVALPSGLVTIDSLSFGFCSSLKQLTFPSSVTELAYAAFVASGIEQITLNEGLKKVGDFAFVECDSIKKISISSTVKYIGYCALTFQNSLEEIAVASGNSNYDSQDGVLFDKAKKRLIAYPANKSPHYDIPQGVTVIDTAAFEGNWRLLSVTIPSSVTELAPEAFYCSSGLGVIDLPSSISKIGNYCFYECYTLSAIFTNSQTPLSMVVSDSIFKDINAGCTLYTPQGSSANYQSSEGWSHYITRIKEYEKVTDNEGNVYHGIQVGSQTWLVENLRTQHYNTNEAILSPTTLKEDLTNWPSANFIWDSDNNISNASVYGRLYTWNAATDSRGICPTGWRLPSISDWETLLTYVKNNNSTSQTKALASPGLWWDDPDAPENSPSNNIASNNESGLLIFPSGVRNTEGAFLGWLGTSYLWSSEIKDGLPYAYHIDNNATSVNGGPNRAQEGFSVRCVKVGTSALRGVKNGKVSVYPNPTSDAIYFKGLEGAAMVTVSDLNGRILISKEITANESVSVGTLSNGMYLTTIYSNQSKKTEKLIIQH